jgi:two-component system CheB/CheR fusion protein
MRLLHNQECPAGLGDAEPELSRITDLLRLRAAHDFTSYKPGTLMRRIKRRMAIHAIDEVSSYLALLLDDAKEIDILAQDLLIHVTSFFRDTAVFELLAAKVIPELVRQHPAGQPIRVWVPACSSGEEV